MEKNKHNRYFLCLEKKQDGNNYINLYGGRNLQFGKKEERGLHIPFGTKKSSINVVKKHTRLLLAVD